MSRRKTCKDTSNVTSSEALGAGRTPCNSQDGMQTDLFGQDLAPASLFHQRESKKPTKTKDISGPCSFGSSASADLQRLLASKLVALLGDNGSPEYELTWSRWVMPSGVPICRLRASGHRISANDCSGLSVDGRASQETMARNSRPLNEQATMLTAGWQTPKANEKVRSGNFMEGREPNAEEALAFGPGTISSRAATEKAGVLNAAFSLWLMGYPGSWLMALPATAREQKRCEGSATQ